MRGIIKTGFTAYRGCVANKISDKTLREKIRATKTIEELNDIIKDLKDFDLSTCEKYKNITIR